MTSLDQEIRDRIDPERFIEFGTSWDELAAAIRAVLDMQEFSGLTQFQRGWNDALVNVKDRVAVALGITQETTDRER